MLLLGTVLLGRILAAARIVAKAICSSGPAKVISDTARRGWDRCELSSTLKVAGKSASQVIPRLFLIVYYYLTEVVHPFYLNLSAVPYHAINFLIPG